ncbi:uncharacterized protein MELLADRAFT_66768 [Melampsora larici-populina 98AG31]|uniref:Secreted protein n=1 Tax=Melampsora larici-populina (strain 98AG31 / pathotype 3-4-7) TaxID=747676 RepID=F4S0H8_MELLP|nr:uncharacterized protein MELLADRAFT_66768 [Melampsora larici-populina 98AG31]EGG01771.1 secreted protein [Melampsora larici-populina 98AG31]
MVGFNKFSSLLILLVSVCNGAPTTKGDDLNKRDLTSESALTLSAHQKRQGSGNGPPNMPTMPKMGDMRIPDMKMPEMKMPDMKMPDMKMPNMPNMKMPSMPNMPNMPNMSSMPGIPSTGNTPSPDTPST